MLTPCTVSMVTVVTTGQILVSDISLCKQKAKCFSYFLDQSVAGGAGMHHLDGTCKVVEVSVTK